MNYTFRDVDQPNQYSGNGGVSAAANINVGIVTKNVSDRVGLQLTYIF